MLARPNAACILTRWHLRYATHCTSWPASTLSLVPNPTLSPELLPHSCTSSPVPAGLLWEISAELASVGVSLVSPSQELCYLRLGQLRTSAAVSAARLVVELEFKTLQVGGLENSSVDLVLLSHFS